MKNLFETAAASVIGRDHRAAGKNNQDAYCIKTTDRAVIAVVCDGCSEGQANEVGARIGSRILVELIESNLDSFALKDMVDYKMGISPFWLMLNYMMCEKIKEIAQAIYFNLKISIKEYFLFTIIGAIITSEETALFSIGDGLIIVNNEIINIGPFLNNQPPYIGYKIMDTSLRYQNLDLLDFQIHKTMPTQEVNSILLGSDGVRDLIEKEKSMIPGKEEKVGGINQFWENGKYFANPDMMRRKLNLINRDATKFARDSRGNITDVIKRPGLLPDDTTLVVIRHKE